jgi:hypothetical protein
MVFEKRVQRKILGLNTKEVRGRQENAISEAS